MQEEYLIIDAYISQNKDNLLHIGCNVTEICNLNGFYLNKYIILELK